MKESPAFHSTTQSKLTLARFFAWTLMASAIVFAAALSLLIPYLYNHGMDDAAQYYLWEDAQRIQQQVEKTKTLPEIEHFRQVYFSDQFLPSNLATSFSTVEQWQEQNMYYYGVRLLLQCCNNDLIVLHAFDLDADQQLPGLDVQQLVLLIILLTLGFMLIIALWLYKVTLQPVKTLVMLVQQPDAEHSDIHNADIRFEEFKWIAQEWQNAKRLLEEKNQQERLLMKSLNHELRTPMAVVRAALDVLDAQAAQNEKQFSDAITGKLAVIRKANTHMLELTQTLLAIWQNEAAAESPDSLALKALVAELVTQQQTALNSDTQSTGVKLDIADELKIFAPQTVIKIVLNNLIRNGLFHGQGNLIIQATARADGLSIRLTNCLGNPVSNVPQASSKVPFIAASRTDGLGLGLIIAQQACLVMGWQLSLGYQQGHGLDQPQDAFVAELLIKSQPD